MLPKFAIFVSHESIDLVPIIVSFLFHVISFHWQTVQSWGCRFPFLRICGCGIRFMWFHWFPTMCLRWAVRAGVSGLSPITRSPPRARITGAVPVSRLVAVPPILFFPTSLVVLQDHLICGLFLVCPESRTFLSLGSSTFNSMPE